jgi:hypothetical protein
MNRVGRALLRAGEGVIHVLLNRLERLTGYHRDTEAELRADYARRRDSWGRD